MSMLMLPDKKICYLLPLSRELPSPKRLENDLDHAEVRTRKLLYEHSLLHILESVGLFFTDHSMKNQLSLSETVPLKANDNEDIYLETYVSKASLKNVSFRGA